MDTRSEAWLAYFRQNARRPSSKPTGIDAIAPPLRAALVGSLRRFQLGEAGEGRVAHEAARSRDPALDDAMKECIALYVREEGKHARELAAALSAFGAPIPKHHWSESLFRRGRRLLGLRTKMLTIAAAEVVGEAYYGVLAMHVAPLAAMADAIRRDEEQHLGFQAEYFRRVLAHESAAHALALGLAFVGITACAIAMVTIDHAPLFRALGASRIRFVATCVHTARDFVVTTRFATGPARASEARSGSSGAGRGSPREVALRA